MTKRRTFLSNGPESSAPQPGEELPSASAFPAHQSEAEEMTPDVPSTQEERGASEALMESYNG